VLTRWREALLARQEARRENPLFESDYLLGVYDEHRMGAIRFKTDASENFQSDNRATAAPPFTSLRELEQASLQLERDEAHDLPDYGRWLNVAGPRLIAGRGAAQSRCT
jgi:serine/threonine-protein kinase HipA